MERKYPNLRIGALRNVAGPAAIAAALALKPEDATASPFTLPLTVHAGGADWFISNNTSASSGGTGLGITEASLVGPPSRSDAYDGAFVMQVNGTTFQDPTGTVDLTGTTLTSNPAVMSGLTTTVQYFFDSASPTVRVVYSFTNPSGAPITVSVRWGNNLGSDNGAIIVTTSSGDNVLTGADRWVITGYSNVQNDPILTFVRYGPGAATTPSSSPQVPGSGNGLFADLYTLTVPAGQTRSLMFFGRLSQDTSAATSAVTTFNSTASLAAAGLLNGLTAQQESQIVNWSITQTPTSVPAMSPFALGILVVLVGAMATKYVRRLVS